jgi:uncharacterized protein
MSAQAFELIELDSRRPWHEVLRGDIGGGHVERPVKSPARRWFMTMPATPLPPTPALSPKSLIMRHPVAGFLAVAYTVSIGVALLRLQGDIPLPFNLTVLSVVDTVVGVALPAFLVVAAVYGRAGVRDLARRSLRWRVGLRWYLLAVVGLPVTTTAAASALYGTTPIDALASKWTLVFTLLLPDLLLRLVLLNLAEEIGWLGFLQARLQDRYGPLKACGLIEIPFAIWHVPSVLVDYAGQLSVALLVLGFFTIAQLFGRVVIMWLYNSTRRSVLLVGLYHATHNMTINHLPGELLGVPPEAGFFIVTGIVAITAVAIILLTRGRLGYSR